MLNIIQINWLLASGGESKAKSKITVLHLGRPDFGLFGHLLERVLWEKTLGGLGDLTKLVVIQRSLHPSLKTVHANEQEMKQKYQKVCMDEQRTLSKVRHKKGA